MTFGLLGLDWCLAGAATVSLPEAEEVMSQPSSSTFLLSLKLGSLVYPFTQCPAPTHSSLGHEFGTF